MSSLFEERWDQIAALLDEVLPLGADERARVLNEACAHDEELRQEVERILQLDERPHELLDAHAIDVAEAMLSTTSDYDAPLASGDRVGVFQVKREIGHGGMSTVYLAERVDGEFDQRVAIKVLQPGRHAIKMLSHFRSERQILASLSHPNIARVFDGGLTSSGLPYFVMEYVEGDWITRYCDRNELSIRERLSLFATVCSAVQHAHRNLIVHSDIKPSNILVTPEGQVKLVDFGIAKLMEGARLEVSAHTLPDGQLMTPQYAAPEQLKSEPISTATDVYGLGVLLYELLVGVGPYSLAGHSFFEAARMVCEKQPARPSVSVQSIREGRWQEARSAEKLSKQRGLTAHEHQRVLRGDLDAITLKALRKEPEQRYPSVEQLADDVRRYLSAEPVQVRASDFSYRTGKFIRRNVWTVASVFLLIAMMLSSVVVTQMQSRQIAFERQRAQVEAAKSDEVANFLRNLFAFADPDQLGDPEMRVREVLDLGAQQISSLEGQPLVQADMMTLIGSVYAHLGHYMEAEALFTRALALQDEHVGEGDPRTAVTHERLAYVWYRQGRFESAEARVRRAIAIVEDELGPESPELVRGLNTLAMILAEQGQPEEAEALLRRSLAIREHHPDQASEATLMHNLATNLHDQNRFEEAIALHRQSLELMRAAHGEPHSGVANAISALAFTLQRTGALDEAEALHREALAMRRVLFGENHPHVASSLIRLGLVLAERGSYQEIEAMARQAHAILSERLPPGHWQIAAAEGLLGIALAGQGEVAEGEAMLLRAYRVLEAQFGPDDWRTQEASRALERLYEASRQQQEARLREDIAIRRP